MTTHGPGKITDAALADVYGPELALPDLQQILRATIAHINHADVAAAVQEALWNGELEVRGRDDAGKEIVLQKCNSFTEGYKLTFTLAETDVCVTAEIDYFGYIDVTLPAISEDCEIDNEEQQAARALLCLAPSMKQTLSRQQES